MVRDKAKIDCGYSGLLQKSFDRSANKGLGSQRQCVSGISRISNFESSKKMLPHHRGFNNSPLAQSHDQREMAYEEVAQELDEFSRLIALRPRSDHAEEKRPEYEAC